MTTQQAINSIYAPKGISSVLAGVAEGDFSVLNNQKGIEASFDKAVEMTAKYQQQLDNCQSDWAYWSILGDLAYWKAIKNIFEAAKINNGILADVEAPDLKFCVVMDAIGKVEDFGNKVLQQTKLLAASR